MNEALLVLGGGQGSVSPSSGASLSMAEDGGGELSVADSLTWPCPWPPLRSEPPLAPLALQLRSGPGAVARHLQCEARGTPPEDGWEQGWADGLGREVVHERCNQGGQMGRGVNAFNC